MHIKSFSLLKNLGYNVITTVPIQEEFKKASDKIQSHDFFFDLLNSEKIQIYPLAIEDIVEMANIPESRRASIGELSCIVLGKRLGCKVMTDDNKAVKYINRYLSMPQIITIVDILLEAYLQYFIGDDDLRKMQATLKNNRYNIKMDLVAEAARRRLMLNKKDSIN